MAKKKTVALRKQRQKKMLWVALGCLCVIAFAAGLVSGLNAKDRLTGKHYVAIDVKDRGTITAEGSSRELLKDPKVREAYLGKAVAKTE